MDVLIEQYYFRLPKEVRELPETIVIFDALLNNRRWDAEVYISDLASTEKMNYSIQNLHIASNRQKISDFRIRKLDIANFRKFRKEKECPYQVSFLDGDNRLSSLFLVGKNSSGKTSIYTALEYLLTPSRISTMKQRNIQDEESFLPYGNLKLKDIELKAVLNDGGGTDVKEPLKVNLSLIPFFCSDFDVQEIQGSNDLETIFARNLGFGSIEFILKVLTDTVDRITHLGTVEEDGAFTNVDVDIVQTDLFYLGGYKTINNKEDRFTAMIRMLDVLAKKLAKVDAKNISSVDSTEFVDKLKVVLDAWELSKELNALSLYQSKKQQVVRYRQIKDLLNEGNWVDAEEMYGKVEPIETFAAEVVRNASFLYKTFSGGNPASRREVALKAILDIGKLKQEMDRQELIRKNAESINLQPKRLENVKKIHDAIYALYEEDKKDLKRTSKELIVKLLNEFTMKEYGSDQKETIDIIEDEANGGRLKAVVRNEKIFGKDEASTPERFYNSFRYKLYCISIKVVMAFMTMKMKGINAPLVFDDVFTASDFDNTVNISKFFEIVFRVFKEIEEKNMSELQIIMFTHDEVVLNSMADILDNLMADGMKEPPVRYITGVLMNPNYIDEHEKTKDNAYSLYSRINC